MNPVGRAFWFIESHFGDELKREAIATQISTIRSTWTRFGTNDYGNRDTKSPTLPTSNATAKNSILERGWVVARYGFR